MDKDQAIGSALQYTSSLDSKVTKAALHIKGKIQELRASCKDLPIELTAETLADGQAEPPGLLLPFLGDSIHWFRIP